MRIVGLDHVQLAMPRGQEDEARRFYRDVLGLTERPKPEPLASRGGCWFEGGGAIVHLGVEDPFTPARKAHPALLVADFDDARRTLDEAEIPYEVDAALEDTRRLYMLDPFGNRLELIRQGDGFGDTPA